MAFLQCAFLDKYANTRILLKSLNELIKLDAVHTCVKNQRENGSVEVRTELRAVGKRAS